MEEKILFQSEITYDANAHKEFSRVNMQSLCFNSVVRMVAAVLLAVMFCFLSSPMVLRYALIYAGLFLFVALLRKFLNRKGDMNYRRLLRSNNEQPPHQLVQFLPEGIHAQNLDNGKELQIAYRNVSFLMESENLLVLVDDLKLCHTIDKRTLTGGSRDDLVAHLRRVCPKLKRIIRRGTLGKIANTLLSLVLVCGIIYGIAGAFYIPQRLSGRMHNGQSYEEMAQQLSELGIVISSQTIEEMYAYDAEYARDHGDYYLVNSGNSKVYDLLSWEGCGIYDPETWEWTPSTSGVYWFDTEVMNVSSIYADFLRGVDAMDETLRFSHITEDYSAVDLESGMGIVTFSFDYLGKTHTLNAQYQYDWFDTNMLTHLGRILRQDSDEKDLWYSFDGQGILLYYGTAEEAAALEQKTGIILLDPVNHPLYS